MLLLSGTAVVAAVVPGPVSAAWPTNTAELDSGSCGQNLQVGSDRTASMSPTPAIFVWGDGGLSSYLVSIDGNPLGTYYSTGRGVVCIQVTQRLADGKHVVTGTELAPHAGSQLTPFSFSVDTVAPDPPSRPIVSAYSDSAAVGDGITSYRVVNFT